MERGFIFTMDAVLALIPVFILLASITMVGNVGETVNLQVGSVKNSLVASNVLYILAKQGVLSEISESIIAGKVNDSRNIASKWLNATLPEGLKYKMEMIYPNGSILRVAGDEPPINASVDVSTYAISQFLGGQGYLGQAWYVGTPPSINVDADDVMSDKNGDGVVNASDQVYLGRCPTSWWNPRCTYDSSETDSNGWYYFNFTIPGEPVFVVLILTTNSDHHSYEVQIKNSKTGNSWRYVAEIEQLWYSTQIDLTKWTVGNGGINYVRIRVYGNVHRSSPYRAYIRGNSKIISIYGTGVNVMVEVNDSTTDPYMQNSYFSTVLNTPDPSSAGPLLFSRLYLPAGWHTYRMRVWVDGRKVFDTGYGYYNWDNAATAAIIDLTQYLKSPGAHTLSVSRERGYWYASPTLIRAYIKGPVLLQTVNLPYNPPWPNPGGHPSQTYYTSFIVPDPKIAVNATATNAVFLLNADEDADTAVVKLNGNTIISDSQYSYDRYKFVSVHRGDNNLSVTLINTKSDPFYVQGPGNQLLIGYEVGKLAFSTGIGQDAETAKKDALEQLLIKMGYDTNNDSAISATELDDIKDLGIISYSGSAPDNWVTNSSFKINWSSSDVRAIAAQRIGEAPGQLIFKLYLWRE